MDRLFIFKNKFKQLIVILLPILVTQLAIFSMNFFDTMMSGMFSATDLAGVAIGSSIWMPVFTGLSGVLLAVTPIVSQLRGAKKFDDVCFTVVQAIYLGLAISFIVLILGYFCLNPLLVFMNLDPKVHFIAFHYLLALSTGISPLFVYNVLRNFIDSLGKTRTSMYITILALPINILANYVFIFGKFGLPKLGGVGAGYATSITYWFIMFLTLFIINKFPAFTSYRVFTTFPVISIGKWKEILAIGMPIGFSIFFETSIFATVTLLMSNFDTNTIASHQAALNFASLLYMIPLSIAMALTIIIGFEIGSRRYKEARDFSKIGLVTAVFFAVLCGTFLYIFKERIAGLYSNDPFVIKLTSQFLLYAIFFQLSDAIQAPIQGILRGYKDVNITFLMTLISYWVIGLPLGYLFANFTRLGAFGYWIGLIAGLAAGALGLSLRLHFIQKKKFPLNNL